jgi:hypothetical protein
LDNVTGVIGRRIEEIRLIRLKFRAMGFELNAT